MVWTITPGNLLVDDPDAIAYLAAVEAADGQALESGVRLAVNAFVKGCKADGIWPAIKASCILAGARTLAGALVPLVGAAPTNNNFVSGDYDRKTGLVGNASTKYLDSGRANNADPQTSQHLAVYINGRATPSVAVLIGDFTSGQAGSSYMYDFLQGSNRATVYASRNATEFSDGNASLGFKGMSRNASTSFVRRAAGSSNSETSTSNTPTTGNIHVFRVNRASNNLYSDNRIAFYSIGEALNLTLLDARVTTLINALSAAIP